VLAYQWRFDYSTEQGQAIIQCANTRHPADASSPRPRILNTEYRRYLRATTGSPSSESFHSSTRNDSLMEAISKRLSTDVHCIDRIPEVEVVGQCLPTPSPAGCTAPAMASSTDMDPSGRCGGSSSLSHLRPPQRRRLLLLPGECRGVALSLKPFKRRALSPAVASAARPVRLTARHDGHGAGV